MPARTLQRYRQPNRLQRRSRQPRLWAPQASRRWPIRQRRWSAALPRRQPPRSRGRRTRCRRRRTVRHRRSRPRLHPAPNRRPWSSSRCGGLAGATTIRASRATTARRATAVRSDSGRRRRRPRPMRRLPWSRPTVCRQQWPTLSRLRPEPTSAGTAVVTASVRVAAIATAAPSARSVSRGRTGVPSVARASIGRVGRP